MCRTCPRSSRVVRSCRSIAPVQALANGRLCSSDDSVSYYKCDITSSPAVSETAAAIRRDVGPPSILVNNAGIAATHNILDTSEDFLEKLFRVNLLSHWITIKEFLPAMLEAQKGRKLRRQRPPFSLVKHLPLFDAC